MGRANESIDSWRGTAAQRRGALFLAGGFALGIAIGWVQPWSIVWPWLGLAAAALAAALRWRARAAASLPCIAIASIGLGVAWVTLRQHYVEPNDLAAMVSDEPVLVRLRGELLRSPQIRDRAAGSLGLFDYRGPVTYFPLRVEALLPRSGAEQAVRGRVLVRVDEPLNMLRAGDEVEAMGFLARPREPHNPGEFNYARYAATLGQAGILVVESRENLRILTADAPSWWARLRQWHEQLQRRASGWLLADLPASRSSAADGLLADLLLGQRDLQIESVEESFRRVGLSHLLAISGAHMAVLAGVVLLVLRLGGQPRRWHALVVIAAVVIYMLLIEVRVPVLRSAIMIVTACIGQLFSRRLSAAGLLELSAVLVLLWRPDQLFDAGFQLSYAAVLGLIYLSPLPDRARAPLRAARQSRGDHWLDAAAVVVHGLRRLDHRMGAGDALADPSLWHDLAAGGAADGAAGAGGEFAAGDGIPENAAGGAAAQRGPAGGHGADAAGRGAGLAGPAS